MSENLDLFGHPLRDWSGRRCRPPYEATEKDRNKVQLLLAAGWSNERIANAIGASLSTIERHFRAELNPLAAFIFIARVRPLQLAPSMLRAVVACVRRETMAGGINSAGRHLVGGVR
jgi:hypothetical protein